LNLGEQMAEISTLGTAEPVQTPVDFRDAYIPTKPRVGASSSGSATSALTPHTIVVSPNLTSAEPSAVLIEPGTLSQDTGRYVGFVNTSGYLERPEFCNASAIWTNTFCQEFFKVGPRM
jgi:hypothetical protein